MYSATTGYLFVLLTGQPQAHLIYLDPDNEHRALRGEPVELMPPTTVCGIKFDSVKRMVMSFPEELACKTCLVKSCS